MKSSCFFMQRNGSNMQTTFRISSGYSHPGFGFGSNQILPRVCGMFFSASFITDVLVESEVLSQLIMF